MKIVVTGGTGYIGRRLIERLAGAGHTLLSLSRSQKPDHLCAQHIRCDITDLNQFKSINAHRYDLLIHLAAQPSAAQSRQIPHLDIETNILGTVNTIEFCRVWGIPRILLASTWNVYGPSGESGQLSETHPCHPISVYGLSKHSAEQLLRIYAEPFGITWNILRLFNVYGPGQDSHKTGHGVVDIFWNQLDKKRCIALKGKLDRYRDFVYIDDAVTSWELIANNQNKPNQIYNVGTGIKTEYRLLIASIVKLLGLEGRITIDELDGARDDVFGAYADISKIAEDLNFRPRHNLEQGLEKILNWKRQHEQFG